MMFDIKIRKKDYYNLNFEYNCNNKLANKSSFKERK